MKLKKGILRVYTNSAILLNAPMFVWSYYNYFFASIFGVIYMIDKSL